MMIDNMFGQNTALLEKSIGLRIARHNLLASNIANAETPDYRAVDIDFQETMERYMQKAQPRKGTLEMQKTSEKHIALEDLHADKSGLAFAAGDDISFSNDNNSVNVEEQLARMQANTMMFSTTTALLNKKISSAKSVLDAVGRI